MENLRQQFDRQNLHAIISDLPNQLTSAWDFTKVKFSSHVQKIFVFGMGGSALPANIFKTYLHNSGKKFTLLIHLVRGYDLPDDFDQSSGGIFISYSGNTEEVLSCFDQAQQKNQQNLIAMATGGQLEKQAEKNSVAFIKIPDDVAQPRFGYGYFVGALMKIFHNSGLININEQDLKATVADLLQINNETEKQGQKLAQSLKKKIPVIYTSDSWKYLAMVIKINFNENAKIQSFWNCFPELNHNEMVGYTHLLADYKIIIFQDLQDHLQIQKRMKIFQKILGNKIDIEIIDIKSGNCLYKIFSTLMLGLWASYYLALINNIDPAPVQMVEKFKKLI